MKGTNTMRAISDESGRTRQAQSAPIDCRLTAAWRRLHFCHDLPIACSSAIAAPHLVRRAANEVADKC
jgi:hypothetical protein